LERKRTVQLDIVCRSPVKRPYPDHRDTVFKPDHRDTVFKKARSALFAAPFRYELGWFHVLKDFEGNRATSRMVENLMPWADVASRIDNSPCTAR
jgi:hypothetical protein